MGDTTKKIYTGAFRIAPKATEINSQYLPLPRILRGTNLREVNR